MSDGSWGIDSQPQSITHQLEMKCLPVARAAAVHRPDLIDPALLRPGRLDLLLYVGVAEDSDSKLKVLQALTRKFELEADIDLAIIAEKCPPTFTGADLYALSSDAWMTALKRTVAQVSHCHTNAAP